MLESFHFLRPGWLLTLLPAGWLLWRIWTASDAERHWRGIISPQLLKHLISTEETRSRVKPLGLLAPIWLLGILALAGPAWQREPAPFANDTASLVFLLHAGESMQAQDVQPTRQQRAVQKIGDLLALRSGSRSGLIAYAASAHLVMPLTQDKDILQTMAAEISSDIMPRGEGSALADAVTRGYELLERSGDAGSLLVLTDAVEDSELESLRQAHSRSGIPIHFLAIAAPPEVEVRPGGPPAAPLDVDALKKASSAGGGELVVVTPDASDVERLAGIVTTSFSHARGSGESEHWKDAGYWLMPFICLLAIVWSRPGWAVRWPQTQSAGGAPA